MENQLVVHLSEVSEVALSGNSAGKAAYDVTIEVNGSVLTSSTKRNPIRSVFMEEFKFMVKPDQADPEIVIRIYEAPHEGSRKELGHTKLHPKESAKMEVLLRAVTNSVVAKAEIAVTLPPKKFVPKPRPEPEEELPNETGIPRTLLYIGAFVVAVLMLAVVGEYAFSGTSHEIEGYNKLRFQQLLAGEYVTACVHIYDLNPDMASLPSTYQRPEFKEDMKQCTDIVLHMQYNGNLVLAHGTSPRNRHTTIWTSQTGRWWWRSKNYAAEMSPDGMITITRKNKVLWMNPFSIYPELRCVLSPL